MHAGFRMQNWKSFWRIVETKTRLMKLVSVCQNYWRRHGWTWRSFRGLGYLQYRGRLDEEEQRFLRSRDRRRIGKSIKSKSILFSFNVHILKRERRQSYKKLILFQIYYQVYNFFQNSTQFSDNNCVCLMR